MHVHVLKIKSYYMYMYMLVTNTRVICAVIIKYPISKGMTQSPV